MQKPVPSPAPSVPEVASGLDTGLGEEEVVGDFFCLSEFSELQGPVVALRLPGGHTKATWFDLESFVLRIMAVDYQSTSSEGSAFAEDTQAVLPQGDDSAAYVHHSTLLDLKARGYARPVCYSYVSRVPSKIMSCFLDLLREFTAISCRLKYGNHVKFLEDLEEVLSKVEARHQGICERHRLQQKQQELARAEEEKVQERMREVENSTEDEGLREGSEVSGDVERESDDSNEETEDRESFIDDANNERHHTESTTIHVDGLSELESSESTAREQPEMTAVRDQEEKTDCTAGKEDTDDDSVSESDRESATVTVDHENSDDRESAYDGVSESDRESATAAVDHENCVSENDRESANVTVDQEKGDGVNDSEHMEDRIHSENVGEQITVKVTEIPLEPTVRDSETIEMAIGTLQDESHSHSLSEKKKVPIVKVYSTEDENESEGEAEKAAALTVPGAVAPSGARGRFESFDSLTDSDFDSAHEHTSSVVSSSDQTDDQVHSCREYDFEEMERLRLAHVGSPQRIPGDVKAAFAMGIIAESPNSSSEEEGVREKERERKKRESVEKQTAETLQWVSEEQAEESRATVEEIYRLRLHVEAARAHLSPSPSKGPNYAIGALVSALSDSATLKGEIHEAIAMGRSFQRMTPLSRLCGRHFSHALSRLRLLHRHFSRPPALLALERDDLSIASPASSLLTIGGAATVNFAWESCQAPETSPLAEAEPSTESDLVEEDDTAEAEAAFLLEDSPAPTPAPDSYDPLNPTSLPMGSCRLEVESFASSLFDGGRRGRGMLAARGRFSFMRHLLYSLLRGRTVVVYAHRRNEQHVRQLVEALSLFVPGASTQKVVAWQERPLQLHELATVKLVGLSKKVASIAKGVVQYSSILDYENETLQAPRYQHGDFIDVLLCPKKQWPSDETYVAYLHYQLFAFGIKACLYYRMCCVAITKSSVTAATGARKATAATLQVLGNESILRDVGWQYSLTQSTRSRDEDTPVPLMGVPAELREQSRAVFSLAVKDMLPSDLAIIEYLADIVKEQQAVEMRAVDPNAPLIRLSSAVLTNFTNAAHSKR